jgi:hypothetical protein
MDEVLKIAMKWQAYLVPLSSVVIWYLSALLAAHVADNATQDAQRSCTIGVWVGLFVSAIPTVLLAYYFYSTIAALIFLTSVSLLLCLTVILIGKTRKR